MNFFEAIVNIYAPKVEDGLELEQPDTSRIERLASSSPESRILSQINEYREQIRLSSVILDRGISQIALTHSRWMDERSHLTHAGWKEGRGQKVLRLGFVDAGEILAEAECYDYELAKFFDKIVPGWIGSTGHHAVIKTGGFTHTGIAFSVSRLPCEENDELRVSLFVTQIFATKAR